jgi:hypothetical protein
VVFKNTPDQQEILHSQVPLAVESRQEQLGCKLGQLHIAKQEPFEAI